MPCKHAHRSFDLPQFNPTAPPTPPESVKGFRTDTDITLAEDDRNDASKPRSTCTYRLESPTEYLLDWTLKFIGATCAILFGIWAPLAYRLQSEGNKGNDEEMKKLRAEVRALGVLRAYEFCEYRVSFVRDDDCWG
jgi:hypothetical protein